MLDSVRISPMLVLAAVIAAISCIRLGLLIFGARYRHILHSRSYKHSSTRRVSIVVAARNEEQDIEACVKTLLDQDYPDYEVIVVDDRSTDTTPEILSRLEAASAGRLRFLRVDHLTEGWFGKPRALHHAARAASGELLLFTDADCRMTSKHTLRIAVCDAIEHGADLLTITPRFHPKSAVDCTLLPEAVQALMLWFLPFRVNDPDSSTAYANGSFILITRECYERVGGHASLRNDITEDIGLARRAKALERRVRMVDNADLFQARAYGSLSKAWHGWSRIFTGGLRSCSKLAVTITALLTLELLPAAGLAVMLCRPDIAPVGAWGVYVGLWAVSVAITHVICGAFMCIMGINPWRAVGHLGGVVFVLAVATRALLNHIGVTATHWSGVSYARNQVIEVREPAG